MQTIIIEDHQAGEILAEFMGFERKSYRELYNLYTVGEVLTVGEANLNDLYYCLPPGKTWLSAEIHGLRSRTSWDYLMPVVQKIYNDHGYIIWFYGNEGKIVHEDVYKARVFGKKLMKYYFDSIFDKSLTSQQIVQELCIRFVMNLNKNHAEHSN